MGEHGDQVKRPRGAKSPPTQDHWQLRFGGMGGQGVLVVGDTFALGAALAGWHVAGSTSYGAQARGGASRADVVMSKEPIDFPHVEVPDAMLLLSQEAYDAYTTGDLPPLIVLDSFVIKPRDLGPAVRQIALDGTGLALSTLENRQGANFVMLGAFLGATGVLTVDEVGSAVERITRPDWWSLNKRALQIGHDAVAALCASPS